MEILHVDGYCDRWDSFVDTSVNGTIFHTLRFLSYHSPGKFDFFNLMVNRAGRVLAVIPGAKALRGKDLIFRSPAGASFGGLVIGEGMDLDQIWGVVDLVVDHLRNQGISVIDLEMPPICYWKKWDRAIDFTLLQFGFRHIGSEATAVIDLDDFDLSRLDSCLVRNLRKAESGGIRVEQSRDLACFYNLLASCLRAKGAIPTHSLEDLEKLSHLLGDKMVLFQAFLDTRAVGGVLVFKCNQVCSLAFYICDDAQFRPMRVVEKLLYEVALALRNQNYRYLDLGTVSIEGKPNWGLLRFKRKFGARIYTRDRYKLSMGGAD